MTASPYDTATTKTLQVAGEPLALTYLRLPSLTSGTARQFLLLHGNPSNLGSWSTTIPALRELGDVCALDLPGFGRSQTPTDGDMSLDRLADGALAMADAAGFTQVIAVGNSFGGGVAQTLAARHPDRVRGVILLASIGTPANPTIRRTFLPFAEGVSSFVAHRLAKGPFRALGHRWASANAKMNCQPDPVPEGFAEMEFDAIRRRPEIQGNSVRAFKHDPTRQLVAQASKLRAPVLILHPVDDRVVPMVYAQNLRKVLSDAGVDVTLKTVPGGHAAHLAHPSEVNAAMRAWVLDKLAL